MLFSNNIAHKIWNFCRQARLKIIRFSIKEKSPQRTILCNMCLGGVVSHNLNLQFLSPFINLMIPANEYVDLLYNIKNIKEFQLIEEKERSRYPIGLLNNKYHIHFLHYNSFSEASYKWYQRTNRMLEPYFIILVETASCKYQDLERFDKLPYKNKIAITHKIYPEIKCHQYIRNYDGKNYNGEILHKSNRLLGSCIYDQIDWVKFLLLK